MVGALIGSAVALLIPHMFIGGMLGYFLTVIIFLVSRAEAASLLHLSPLRFFCCLRLAFAIRCGESYLGDTFSPFCL